MEVVPKNSTRYVGKNRITGQQLKHREKLKLHHFKPNITMYSVYALKMAPLKTSKKVI